MEVGYKQLTNCWIFSTRVMKTKRKVPSNGIDLIFELHSNAIRRPCKTNLVGLFLTTHWLTTTVTSAFRATGEASSWGIFTVSKSACMTFSFNFFFQVDVRLHWSLRVLHQADPKGAIPMNMTHSQCQIEPAQRNCYALWVGSSRYEIGWTAPYTLWLTICVLDWSFWSKQNCNANTNIQYFSIACNAV